MHAFSDSGLVAYGLKGMFAPIWTNDISEQKAAVYETNFGGDYFELDNIKIFAERIHLCSFVLGKLSVSGFVFGCFLMRNLRF